MAKKRREKKFNSILLKAIDEAFLTLGENAKTSLYFHLETKFAVSKQDIPDRVGDFSDALEQIFGLAARNLEILIMKCLNEKIKCSYEWAGPKWLVPDLTFEKYVKLLELWCEEPGKAWQSEVTIDARKRQEQQAQ